MQTVNWNDPDLTLAGIDIGGGEIYNYQGAPFTGVLQFSFPNGNLETEITCVNGRPEGVWRGYYPNGQMMEEFYFKYNQEYGPYTRWDENGNVIKQFDFGPEPQRRIK